MDFFLKGDKQATLMIVSKETFECIHCGKLVVRDKQTKRAGDEYQGTLV